MRQKIADIIANPYTPGPAGHASSAQQLEATLAQIREQRATNMLLLSMLAKQDRNHQRAEDFEEQAIALLTDQQKP